MLLDEMALLRASLSGGAAYAGGLGWYPDAGRGRADGFSGYINHLVLLRSRGAIDEQVFAGLIRQAAALFIEAEVADCVNRVVSRGFMQLQLNGAGHD